jgi:GGDEF domain-containing protein
MSKGEKRDFHFRSILDREFQQARKSSLPLTLFLIDVIDKTGEAKDNLLNPLEEKVKQCLWRNTDVTLKREDEKILVAICGANIKGAQAIQQRIEEKVLKPFARAFDPPLIIKMGAATYPEEALSQKELFSMAQERLRG